MRALSEGLRQEVKPYNDRTTITLLGAVATELTETIADPTVAEDMSQVYLSASSRGFLCKGCGLCDEPAGGVPERSTP